MHRAATKFVPSAVGSSFASQISQGSLRWPSTGRPHPHLHLFDGVYEQQAFPFVVTLFVSPVPEIMASRGLAVVSGKRSWADMTEDS